MKKNRPNTFLNPNF